MIDKNDDCFSVKHQFEQYAFRVRLNQNEVSETQWIETRRAFYGAFGQALIMLRDQLAELSEDEGVEVLQKMYTEVSVFWHKENNRQN